MDGSLRGVGQKTRLTSEFPAARQLLPPVFNVLTRETTMQQLKEVMSRNVKVLSPDATLMDAARQMRDGDYGLMPVGENDRMIGAISDRDIVVRAIAEHKGPDTPVREVMSNEILWAYENDSVEKATRMMSEHQVRRLPIVNADKRHGNHTTRTKSSPTQIEPRRPLMARRLQRD